MSCFNYIKVNMTVTLVTS